MAITDWPKKERPREKLLTLGPKHLSDAELLAIFLRTGIKGHSAVDLARNLLNHFGSLNRIFTASQVEFSTIPGMGVAKYSQLQIVLEMARRSLTEELSMGDVLNSATAVRQWLVLHLAHLPHEVFLVLLLDTQNRLQHSSELFRGTLTQASVYPREVVKLALAHNAAAVIFAHNHPGGCPEPSRADERLTHSLKQALALVDIHVLDHFIVTRHSPPLSFAERGLI